LHLLSYDRKTPSRHLRIGAPDMADRDLYGKSTGKPVWRFLGGARREFITPYASLIPEGWTLEVYRKGLLERAKRAQSFGFGAAKMERFLWRNGRGEVLSSGQPAWLSSPRPLP
jgi:L-alanine-DL-glutamate epimerase-like enolase superfamily enzyme